MHIWASSQRHFFWILSWTLVPPMRLQSAKKETYFLWYTTLGDHEIICSSNFSKDLRTWHLRKLSFWCAVRLLPEGVWGQRNSRKESGMAVAVVYPKSGLSLRRRGAQPPTRLWVLLNQTQVPSSQQSPCTETPTLHACCSGRFDVVGMSCMSLSTESVAGANWDVQSTEPAFLEDLVIKIWFCLYLCDYVSVSV